MYQIYFATFQYFSERTFSSFEEAVGFAKETGMTSQIHSNGRLVAIWDYFTGLRKIA